MASVDSQNKEEDLLGLDLSPEGQQDTFGEHQRGRAKSDSFSDIAKLSFSVETSESKQTKDGEVGEEAGSAKTIGEDDADNRSVGSGRSSEESSSAGQNDITPDGFAFPVTKRIIHFLNRFSTAQSDSMLPFPNISQMESPDQGETNSLPSLETSDNDGKDSSNQQTKPNSTYSKLIQMLRHPQASDLVATIKSFVSAILADQNRSAMKENLDEEDLTWDGDRMPGQDNQTASRVQAFLRSLEKQIRSHPLWKNVPIDEWGKMEEGLEKFILGKIEKKIFQPTERDRLLDAKLKQRIQSLSFLKPDHLEVTKAKPGTISKWMQAGEALCSMNKFRTPRDKLVCIQNCAKLIVNILKDVEVSEAESDGRLQVGADEFVPALIYVVLKSNPENLYSNIEYVAAYRNPARLSGEAGYYFTQLTMAVSFIQTLDAKSLTIKETTFTSGVRYCLQNSRKNPNFSCGWEGFSGDLEEVCAQLLLSDRLDIDQWKAQRFRFANTNVEDLRIADVHALMEEYKSLVKIVDQALNEKRI